jgi:hypothetical protein
VKIQPIAEKKGGQAASPSSIEGRQEQLFLTTIGGGAATAELAYQIVGDRRRSKSLKLPGFALDLSDRSSLVAKSYKSS